jgi:copper chaperone CopZ
MADGPKAGLAALIAAKLVCCGGLVLFATGALSLAGVAGWLQEGGFVWLAVVGLSVVALYLWRSRHARLFGVFEAETRNNTTAVATSAGTPEDESPLPDAKSTSLWVEGMTCVRCANNARYALLHAPGVIEAEVELETGLASVTYDPKAITTNQMMAPLRDLGFLPAPATLDEVAGRSRNNAITVPPGCTRTSFQADDLHGGHELAEARRIILALPGVRDAGAHRRGYGEKAAIVWAIFDPEDVTPEQIAAAVHGMGCTLAGVEEDSQWAPTTVS